MPAPTPDYVPGHGLLAGKIVVVTAAAGTGIGFAAAKRCVEEGAQRAHLATSTSGGSARPPSALAEVTARAPATALCNVTVEADVDGAVRHRDRRSSGTSTC